MTSDIRDQIETESPLCYDFKKDIKIKVGFIFLFIDETLKQVIKQYEQRINSLRLENENTEKKISILNDRIKKLITEKEESKIEALNI